MRTTAQAVVGALVAPWFLTSGTIASAADLGGDCCADLEERIAELEATAARKGNRKVSLTISGYVAQEVTWWDDGGESNIYLHGMGPTQTTHVKFSGQAQISPGWTAGYMLRIQSLDDNPFGRNAATGDALNQNNDNFSSGLNAQMSYWFIQSKDLGKLSVGRQAAAAKSAVMFTDQSGTQVIDNYTFLAGFPQFFVRSDGDLAPAVTWGQFAFCYHQGVPLGGDCNGIVMNAVRYDTPAFAGFTASASWGEDDFWEVALRYSGELSGFKIALGAGYSEATDEALAATLPPGTVKDTSFFQAGGYVQHIETGLFLHTAYGFEDNSGTRIGIAQITPENGEHWYLKGGIRKKWSSLGATVIYGDYAEYLDQIGPGALALDVTDSTLRRFGGGIAQEIDAAAMTVYLKYQRYDLDASGPAADPGLTELESMDLVSFGGLINF